MLKKCSIFSFFYLFTLYLSTVFCTILLQYFLQMAYCSCCKCCIVSVMQSTHTRRTNTHLEENQNQEANNTLRSLAEWTSASTSLRHFPPRQRLYRNGCVETVSLWYRIFSYHFGKAALGVGELFLTLLLLAELFIYFKFIRKLGEICRNH